jgi:hypothetical protein
MGKCPSSSNTNLSKGFLRFYPDKNFYQAGYYNLIRSALQSTPGVKTALQQPK